MKTNFDEVKIFIEKIGLINFKYEEILHAREYDFNIFSILRNDNDEVNLHSRFIYEILNPNGTHHKGDLFLRVFLDVIGIPNFKTTDGAVIVKREYQHIDILIKNRNQAIIIENKINADDQDRQLERYYETIKREGFDYIKVIYLTLYGDEPSDESIGNLKKVEDDLIMLASYRDDIDTWIDECIKESAGSPILRETLFQYQILIQKLTGKYHSKGYMMEIKELLIDEKNIRLATDICQALTDSKIEIQHSFWQNLSSDLKKLGYIIPTDGICTKNDVKAYYYKSKNNKYYGINFDLTNLDEGEKLQFCIEIDWNIYYGFYVKKDGSEGNIQLDSKYDDLADIISKTDSNFVRNEWWLGWKCPNRKYDFRSFNDENTFALANDMKRKGYTNELAVEIHNIIKSFSELFKAKNGG